MIYFAFRTDHRIKLNECEERNQFLELARELTPPWNINISVILILIRALGTLTKGLVKQLEDLEIRGRVEHFRDRPEYWEESWTLEETFCHSESSKISSANGDV